MSLATFEDGYLEAAFFTSTDENDEPFDANYSHHDLDPVTRKRMRMDCEEFYTDWKDTWELVDTGDEADARAGHDFWLTRNGHGAGFWDGDWALRNRVGNDVDQVLTKACKAFGQYDLYLGDPEYTADQVTTQRIYGTGGTSPWMHNAAHYLTLLRQLEEEGYTRMRVWMAGANDQGLHNRGTVSKAPGAFTATFPVEAEIATVDQELDNGLFRLPGRPKIERPQTAHGVVEIVLDTKAQRTYAEFRR